MHREKGQHRGPLPITGPHHGHFPTAPPVLQSAGLHPALWVRHPLLTLSNYSISLCDFTCRLQECHQGCQGFACCFKAALLGSPLAANPCPIPSCGNFHYYVFPLVTISRQTSFFLEPLTFPQRHLFLVVGPCFPPLESHWLLPVFHFLVSGCWSGTRTSESRVAQPLPGPFCICKSYFQNFFS